MDIDAACREQFQELGTQDIAEQHRQPNLGIEFPDRPKDGALLEPLRLEDP